MKRHIFTLFLLVFIGNSGYSQRYDIDYGYSDYPKFYLGLGTNLQSYIGGEFGSTYALRYEDNYYYDDYYYDHYYYDDYYDYNEGMLGPVGVDIYAGVQLNSYLSIELESSFIWHSVGRPDKKYETGYQGEEYYVDYNDESQLYANPIFLGFKFYPASRERLPFFISAGFGLQYMQESMDRVREYYDYEYHYYYNNPTYLIASYESANWMTGFKVGGGFSYNFFNLCTAEAELRYTSFYPEQKPYSPLLMNRVTQIGNLAFLMKLYALF